MSGIVLKSKKDIAKRDAVITEAGFNTGDLVMSDRGKVYKVGNYIPSEKSFKKLSKEQYYDNHDAPDSDGYYPAGSFEPDYFHKYTKLEKSLDEYEDEICDIIKNGLPDLKESENISRSTDLVVSDPNNLDNMKSLIETKMNKLSILENIMTAKKDQLSTLMYNLNKQVEEIEKVVGIINLYLGIDEEIVQIMEGVPATIETKLTFRQLVLHMDEETAITDDGGIDFREIKKFDKWVRKNYKKLIPEEKGVVIARPRRNDKHYSDDELVNDLKNEGNFDTYVLIRNGTNVYRICTNHNIYPYLFPSNLEMEKLQQALDGESVRDDSASFGRLDEEGAEKRMLKYKRNVLLLQGLIDRTDVFKPLPPNMNLMKQETCLDLVDFIYDGTGTISDGRPAFKDWLKDKNSTLKVGDRFYFCGYEDGWAPIDTRMADIGWDSWRDCEDKEIPREMRPDHGVYNIERMEEYHPDRYSDKSESKIRMIVKHNTKDIIENKDWRIKGHVRKRANTYYFYHDDICILNYENINISEMQYYINDRINRQHYLTMLPVLKGIIEQVKSEQVWEQGFIDLLKTQVPSDISDWMIEGAILWWKNKVIQKRPLKSEDAKALRMIKAKVLNIKKDDDEVPF